MTARTWQTAHTICGWRFPAKNIDAVRHGLEMGRANATGHAAEVVNLDSIGNRAKCNLVGPAMGVDYLMLGDSESPVTVPVAGRRPNPALAALINLGPKAVFRGPSLWGHMNTPSFYSTTATAFKAV